LNPQIMVFFHLRPLETPSVPPETRYTVTRVAIPNCYRLVVRHGYMDEVITPDLASLVCEQVRNYIVCQGAALKPQAINGNAKAPTTGVQAREISFTPLSREEKGYSDPEKRSQTTEESIAMDLAKLQQAFDRQVLYIIGKEQMKIKGGTSIWRKILLKAFFWMRDNTRTKVANLRVQPDRVIEMGFVKEI
jgi:KUP system potassium uptake protein